MTNTVGEHTVVQQHVQQVAHHSVGTRDSTVLPLARILLVTNGILVSQPWFCYGAVTGLCIINNNSLLRAENRAGFGDVEYC